MTRLKALTGLIAIALLYTAGSFGPAAMGQEPAKGLKDQLAGAWTLVSIHNVRADGTKYELFGPNAKGMSELKSGTNQPRSAERRRRK
jgi:hypothetical protein